MIIYRLVRFKLYWAKCQQQQNCISIYVADEHLAELMPIFEKIRAQDQVPCAFPIHMGAGGTVFVRCNTSRSVPLSPHVLHCHPTTHWVSRTQLRKQTEVKQQETGPLAGGTNRYPPPQKIASLIFHCCLPITTNRYASVRYDPYRCQGHRDLRFRRARPIRLATMRAAMVDPLAVIRRARSPIRAHARVWRQADRVPAPSPTHARSADKAPSRRHVMALRCRSIAQVGAQFKWKAIRFEPKPFLCRWSHALAHTTAQGIRCKHH